MAKLLLLLFFLAWMRLGSTEPISPEAYWKLKLPYTPMLKSIKDSLPSAGGEPVDMPLKGLQPSVKESLSSVNGYNGLLSYNKESLASSNPRYLSYEKQGLESSNPNYLSYDNKQGLDSNNPKYLSYNKQGLDSNNPSYLSYNKQGLDSLNPKYLSYNKQGLESKNPNYLSYNKQGLESLNPKYLSYNKQGLNSNDPSYLSYNKLGLDSLNPKYLSYNAQLNSNNPSYLSYNKQGLDSLDPKYLSYNKQGLDSNNPNYLSYKKQGLNSNNPKYLSYNKQRLDSKNPNYPSYNKQGLNYNNPNYLSYNKQGLGSTKLGHAKESFHVDDANSAAKDRAFFVEENLHLGTKMTLYFQKSIKKGLFLPREVSNKIPFSSDKIQETLQILSLDPKSKEAYVLSKRIELCEEPTIEGVEKKCVTSLESMVDYVVSKIGTNVKALTTQVEKDSTMEYTIKGVKKLVKDDRETVVCHKLGYPYAVFFCHRTKTIRSYMVSLIGKDGTIIEAVAACHKETNDFLDNYAKNVLKVVPGSTHICHFPSAEDTIIWVPK